MTGIAQEWPARAAVRVGLSAIVLFAAGLLIWACGTTIAGAIIAPGTVSAAIAPVPVRHPDGGIVAKLLARDGDEVAAGDVLIQLDPTYLDAELLLVEQRLADARARASRLVAERDDAAAPAAPEFADLIHIQAPWLVARAAEEQRRFDLGRAALAGDIGRLDSQGRETRARMAGLAAERRSLETQLGLVDDALRVDAALKARALVPAAKGAALSKERAAITGRLGEIAAGTAAAQAQLDMLDQTRAALTNQRRNAAAGQLADLRATLSGLDRERLDLAEKRLRLDLRAPVDGTVFEAQVQATETLIAPSQTVMSIVPRTDTPLVTAHIRTADIDQIRVGQTATLRFAGRDRAQPADASGRVLRISAEPLVATDGRTAYYEAVLEPAPGQPVPVTGLRPGAPVEVFIATQPRRPIAYLLGPVTGYFHRAFRDG